MNRCLMCGVEVEGRIYCYPCYRKRRGSWLNKIVLAVLLLPPIFCTAISKEDQARAMETELSFLQNKIVELEIALEYRPWLLRDMRPEERDGLEKQKKELYEHIWKLTREYIELLMSK